MLDGIAGRSLKTSCGRGRGWLEFNCDSFSMRRVKLSSARMGTIAWISFLGLAMQYRLRGARQRFQLQPVFAIRYASLIFVAACTAMCATIRRKCFDSFRISTSGLIHICMLAWVECVVHWLW